MYRKLSKKRETVVAEALIKAPLVILSKRKLARMRNLFNQKCVSTRNTVLVSPGNPCSMHRLVEARRWILGREKHGVWNSTIPDHLHQICRQLNEDGLGVLTNFLIEELDRFWYCSREEISKRFELVRSSYTVSHGKLNLENVAVSKSVLMKKKPVGRCSVLWWHRVSIAETGASAMSPGLKIGKILVS